MKLYDYMQIEQRDYDCYDTEISCCVTNCYIDEITDDYDRFCVEVQKKVDVIDKISDCELTCNWSKLIKDNYSEFKAFTASEWERDYQDESEFIYQWIKELHSYIAGYVSEDYYKTLYEFIKGLKG